jgi:hypothetical protein
VFVEFGEIIVDSRQPRLVCGVALLQLESQFRSRVVDEIDCLVQEVDGPVGGLFRHLRGQLAETGLYDEGGTMCAPRIKE